MSGKLRNVAPRCAFTLTELVVVIAILGILLALTLQGVQKVRNRAAQVACTNNLRQIGLALHQDEEIHGALPKRPSKVLYGSVDARNGASWMAFTLPFLEQDDLWRVTQTAFQLDPLPWHEPPHLGLSTIVSVYVCPADGRLFSANQAADGQDMAFTSYLGVQGTELGRWDGVLTGGKRAVRLTDIKDGTSNTIMVGERPPSNYFESGSWYLGSRDSFVDQYCVMPVRVPPNFPFAPYKCLTGGGAWIEYGPGSVHNRCDRLKCAPGAGPVC